jgi:1-deoxy-D-xylulose-5-phosphate reductoisomerase
MRIPIAYALSTPKRNNYSFIEKMNFKKLFSLNFKPMDYNRYPLIKLAYEVGEMGGIMPLVYNTANEVAVRLFLNRKIKFLEIDEIINYAVNNTENINNPTLDDILKYDQILRRDLENKFEVK